MKTLLILRHAKSSWKNPGLADRDRPLNQRGKQDAPRIGQLLRDERLTPDLILCSTAQRARDTAEAVAEVSGYEGEIEFKPEFYVGEPEAYLRALRGVSDDYQCVVVVGHNPGLEELVETLSGEAETMPTGALAQVSLPIQRWRQLEGETEGKLINVWRPRELPPFISHRS
jgi:phosphohistidine phosphatase